MPGRRKETRRRQEGDKYRHGHETATPGRHKETEGDEKETKTKIIEVRRPIKRRRCPSIGLLPGSINVRAPTRLS